MTRRKPNAMLIELVIVLMFFAISASIVLQLFVAASEKNGQNSNQSAYLLIAEDYAERFAASKLDSDAFFVADGWTASGNGYEKEAELNGGNVLLSISGGATDTGAGTLDEWVITASNGRNTSVSLPITRYMQKEAKDEPTI